ncbi:MULTISPECIES: hypothetical protein [unclassified Mesobacillus]|uniref:hypothetical protein n=1 Tax=unclassified Mesobacillus TaxID=2675270 RepID=UPI00203E8A8C|nr:MULTISPECIES: hypothetical protein [unclassified Mesobacillus]MCM3124430.1 hypothetical protein [Mesobacillus sp. MER 33]MCM3234860.1 hypothetical protein [Mesobacillus sp. MER 48]
MPNTQQSNKVINTNASSSAFGWDFQTNAAIFFALKNIKELLSFKVEGDIEDIELYLKGNKNIYIQAKSQENPIPGTNTLNKLTDGLKTLINASNQGHYNQLIYISNIQNPLKDKSLDYYWRSDYSIYNYEELPIKAQGIINKYIETAANKYNLNLSNLNLSSLRIGTFFFFGENLDTRYKVINSAVKEFVASAQAPEGKANDLLDYWQKIIFQNSTNKYVKLSKEDFIWPLVVLESSVSFDGAFFDDYDLGQVDEIKRKYSLFIEKKSEQFEFVTRVISHYNDFVKNNHQLKRKESIQRFIDSQWVSYSSDIINDLIDDEIKEGLIRLIIFQILTKRFSIDNVKRAAGL